MLLHTYLPLALLAGVRGSPRPQSAQNGTDGGLSGSAAATGINSSGAAVSNTTAPGNVTDSGAQDRNASGAAVPATPVSPESFATPEDIPPEFGFSPEEIANFARRNADIVGPLLEAATADSTSFNAILSNLGTRFDITFINVWGNWCGINEPTGPPIDELDAICERARKCLDGLGPNALADCDCDSVALKELDEFGNNPNITEGQADALEILEIFFDFKLFAGRCDLVELSNPSEVSEEILGDIARLIRIPLPLGFTPEDFVRLASRHAGLVELTNAFIETPAFDLGRVVSEARRIFNLEFLQFFGNYCGYANSTEPPVDEVDEACSVHGQCLVAAESEFDCECDQALLGVLNQRLASNGPSGREGKVGGLDIFRLVVDAKVAFGACEAPDTPVQAGAPQESNILSVLQIIPGDVQEFLLDLFLSGGAVDFDAALGRLGQLYDFSFINVYGNFCGIDHPQGEAIDGLDAICERAGQCLGEVGSSTLADCGCDAQALRDFDEFGKSETLTTAQTEALDILKIVFDFKLLLGGCETVELSSTLALTDEAIDNIAGSANIPIQLPFGLSARPIVEFVVRHPGLLQLATQSIGADSFDLAGLIASAVEVFNLEFLRFHGQYCAVEGGSGSPIDEIDQACRVHQECVSDCQRNGDCNGGPLSCACLPELKEDLDRLIEPRPEGASGPRPPLEFLQLLVNVGAASCPAGPMEPTMGSGESSRAGPMEPTMGSGESSRAGPMEPTMGGDESSRAGPMEPTMGSGESSRAGPMEPTMGSGESSRAGPMEPTMGGDESSRAGPMEPTMGSGESSRAGPMEPIMGSGESSRGGPAEPIVGSGESSRAGPTKSAMGGNGIAPASYQPVGGSCRRR